MRQNPVFTIFILLTILFLLDLYVFKGLKIITGNAFSPTLKKVFMYGYWAVSIAMLVWISSTLYVGQMSANDLKYQYYFMMFGIGVLLFVPKLIFGVFHLVEDLVWLAMKAVEMIKGSGASEGLPGEKMTRVQFISKLGLGLAAIPFVSIAYGILKGRYDFRVLSETLEFDNLPKAFDGLTIAHISDIHIGSFFDNHEMVKKGIDMVNDLEPDLILFTGDIVNNYAEELKGWAPVLGGLKSKLGTYSILGNHDYSDYVQWEKPEEKQANMERLFQYHKECGFDLLKNENVKLERDGESIHILGVENWGLPPFVQYGDLEKTMRGTEESPFKILMSHDPSHWGEQVLDKKPIDLTLSGHTHGMQFGVEIAGIKWSPVKMKYPRWGGLYTEGKQHLYVNRGFGYLGFPGRVGMPPEITFITLKSKA